MRHSLLITLEFPPQKGGVASYYAGIAKYWRGDLTVLAPLQAISYKLQATSYKLICRPLLGKLWPRWLRAFSEVRKVIKSESRKKIDLLQVGQVLPLGYVAFMIKWLCGIPYLIYTHGMDVTVPARSLWKREMLKLVLGNAKLVVANSEFTKKEVEKLGIDSKKIVVVYPCPDLEVRGGRLEVGNIVLTVSRLVKRKGIDTVLKALPEVLEVVPNVQYVVIGDGPEIANCKLLIVNCKLEHHVQFLGQLSDEERTVWYKRADVFVLVPRRIKGDVEGFGTVYLEANSFGLPVIGSRTGGVPEAVKHGESGLLVEPDDPKETAQAIIKLLTNKQLASKLGRQGKERVISEFQWEKQIQKVVNAEL